MGYIDRSQYLQELRNNPGLVQRLGVIVNGEVGNAPLETKLINLESIFNRAETRGQTLEQVTRQAGQAYPDGKGGYYPASTFAQGNRIMSQGNTPGAFNEQVLKPVLAGSDVSTRVLGFPATGNASDQPGNTVASNGIRNGYYTNYKWLGRELYVNHQPDQMARLQAKRTGDPPVQPPGSIPDPRVGANEQAIDPVTGNPMASTGSIAAAMTGAPSANYPPAQNPGYRLPVQQAVEGGGSVPLPWRRPAGAGPDAAGNMPSQGPSEAQLAGQPARPGTGPMTPLQSIGQKMLDAFHSAGGVVPPGARSYIDPNTGHTIVNPSGSGEQAMGLTRDVGAVPASATGQTVRPAPAPSPAVAAMTAAPPPAGPVSSQRATVPDVLAPLFRHTLDEGPTPPDALRTLDEGPTPASAISPLMSRRTQPDILAGMQTGGGGGRLPLAPRWMSDARPVADARLQPSPVNPTVFDVKQIARQGGPGLAGLSGPVPVAPEAAGLLAAPQQPAPVASSRPPFVQPPNASTQLSPGDELRFQSWLRTNNVNFDPRNTGQPTDYDMRGFFQRQQQGDPIAQNRVDPTDNRMHYPDVWKTPSHETFGAQSMFSTQPNAPDWINDRQMANPSGRLTYGAQSPMDRMLTPPQVFPQSAANAPPLGPPSGGPNVPPIPMTQPTTVTQQLGGLSPFASQAPQPQPQMPFAPTQQEQDQWLSRFLLNPQQTAFASTTLLPFDMMPQTGFDTAGWNSPASYNFGDPG